MSQLEPLETPNRVYARTTAGTVELQEEAHGGGWSAKGISVRLHGANEETIVDLEESADPIFDLHLEWNYIERREPPYLAVLGDAWERAYGDLGWRPIQPNLPGMPWYACARPIPIDKSSIEQTFGVKTAAGSMASWVFTEDLVRLRLDLRSGNRPLRLVGRVLRAAIVVRIGNIGQAALRALCEHPRLAHAPIYGVNDWYYAYGHNTADGILDDSKRAAAWAHGLHNRPFSVIDDGWSASEGTWSHGNDRFPDMPGLAHQISKAGCRPGLWVRPLLCDEKLPAEWFMAPKILDPSRPEALEKVHETIYRIHAWGYELIKHDYSTFDVCGLWGFQMTDGVAGKKRSFHDDMRTTAEILRGLYQTIRDAAGSSLVLGCNTVGHLAAGLEEAQRIGDDTSGREWA